MAIKERIGFPVHIKLDACLPFPSALDHRKPFHYIPKSVKPVPGGTRCTGPVFDPMLLIKISTDEMDGAKPAFADQNSSAILFRVAGALERALGPAAFLPGSPEDNYAWIYLHHKKEDLYWETRMHTRFKDAVSIGEGLAMALSDGYG